MQLVGVDRGMSRSELINCAPRTLVYGSKHDRHFQGVARAVSQLEPAEDCRPQSPPQLESWILRLLSTAATCNHCNVLQYLLEHESLRPRPSLTAALVAAAKAGHLQSVAFLLENGADINGYVGWVSALNMAVRHRHLTMARFLLERGAEDGGVTNSLRLAVDSGDGDMVRLLTQHPQYALGTASRTAALKAAHSIGRFDMIQVLANDIP